MSLIPNPQRNRTDIPGSWPTTPPEWPEGYIMMENGQLTQVEGIDHLLKSEPASERIRRWSSGVLTFFRNLRVWPFSKAVKTLTETLANDPDARWAWHCNIAMPIYDVTRPVVLCTCDAIAKINAVPPPPEGEHFSNCLSQLSENPCANLNLTAEQCNYLAERLMNHLFGKPQYTPHPDQPWRAMTTDEIADKVVSDMKAGLQKCRETGVWPEVP